MATTLELKPNIILQGISKKQYNKLQDLQGDGKRRINASIPLHGEYEGKIGIIREWFIKTNELSEVHVYNYVNNKIASPAIGGQIIFRVVYYNYLTKRWEAETDHIDNKVCAIYALNTALAILDKDDAYAIIEIKNDSI